MRRFETAFVRLNGAVLVLGLMAMSMIVGWNVAGRYLTGNSLTWADEVARYSMIWLTFLGAGLALREGAHAAITNAQDALPDRGQRILRLVILGVLFGFFAFMVWVGIDYMNRMSIQKSAALQVPMRYIYAAMPVGFGMMIVHLAFIAPQYLRAGLQQSDEAAVG